MELCINELAISPNGDLPAHIQACAAQGIHRMELSKAGLLAYLRSGHTVEELAALLQQYAVTPVCLNSIESISFHNKRGLRVLCESAELLFYCCRAIRCPCVEVIASFKAPTDDPAEIAAETVHALRQLADVAKPYGIHLALEYMGVPASSVRTFSQALEIVRAAERENVGLLVDTWHHYAGGSAPEDLLQAKPGEIFLAHISDCPAHRPLEAVRVESFFPGDGAAPLDRMLQNLRAVGYDADLSVEVFAPELRALPTEEYIARAKETVLPLL